MKGIYADENACMGCRLCEVYCQVEHSSSRDILRAFRKERSHLTPRIRIQQTVDGFVAAQCRHCSEPWCVHACLTGALSKDPASGVVTVDSAKCVGCWTCVMACPFGAITPDYAEGVIVKCDLCPERDVPACVAGCPNKALLFTDDRKAPERDLVAVGIEESMQEGW